MGRGGGSEWRDGGKQGGEEEEKEEEEEEEEEEGGEEEEEEEEQAERKNRAPPQSVWGWGRERIPSVIRKSLTKTTPPKTHNTFIKHTGLSSVRMVRSMNCKFGHIIFFITFLLASHLAPSWARGMADAEGAALGNLPRAAVCQSQAKARYQGAQQQAAI